MHFPTRVDACGTDWPTACRCRTTAPVRTKNPLGKSPAVATQLRTSRITVRAECHKAPRDTHPNFCSECVEVPSAPVMDGTPGRHHMHDNKSPMQNPASHSGQPSHSPSWRQRITCLARVNIVDLPVGLSPAALYTSRLVYLPDIFVNFASRTLGQLSLETPPAPQLAASCLRKTFRKSTPPVVRVHLVDVVEIDVHPHENLPTKCFWGWTAISTTATDDNIQQHYGLPPPTPLPAVTPRYNLKGPLPSYSCSHVQLPALAFEERLVIELAELSFFRFFFPRERELLGVRKGG